MIAGLRPKLLIILLREAGQILHVHTLGVSII
jgi:hypothetical protein